MRLPPTLYAVAATCGILSIVVASPIQGVLDMFRHPSSSKSLDERQLFNCTDPAADFSEYCWAQLGLSDYLLNPDTGWFATTRKCSTTNDGSKAYGSNCCKPDQTWSTCYLHLAHGFAGAECSTINSGSCTYDPTLAVDPSIAPKVRYVMRNIYGKFLLTVTDRVVADGRASRESILLNVFHGLAVCDWPSIAGNKCNCQRAGSSKAKRYSVSIGCHTDCIILRTCFSRSAHLGSWYPRCNLDE